MNDSQLAAEFRRNPTVLERAVDGQTVLYLPSSDEVVVLDVIGSEVWRHLVDSTSESELFEALADRFDQPVERITADVRPLLIELWNGGWLQPVQDDGRNDQPR